MTRRYGTQSSYLTLLWRYTISIKGRSEGGREWEGREQARKGSQTFLLIQQKYNSYYWTWWRSSCETSKKEIISIRKQKKCFLRKVLLNISIFD